MHIIPASIKKLLLKSCFQTAPKSRYFPQLLWRGCVWECKWCSIHFLELFPDSPLAKIRASPCENTAWKVSGDFTTSEWARRGLQTKTQLPQRSYHYSMFCLLPLRTQNVPAVVSAADLDTVPSLRSSYVNVTACIVFKNPVECLAVRVGGVVLWTKAALKCSGSVEFCQSKWLCIKNHMCVSFVSFHFVFLLLLDGTRQLSCSKLKRI